MNVKPDWIGLSAGVLVSKLARKVLALAVLVAGWLALVVMPAPAAAHGAIKAQASARVAQGAMLPFTCTAEGMRVDPESGKDSFGRPDVGLLCLVPPPSEAYVEDCTPRYLSQGCAWTLTVTVATDGTGNKHDLGVRAERVTGETPPVHKCSDVYTCGTSLDETLTCGGEPEYQAAGFQYGERFFGNLDRKAAHIAVRAVLSFEGYVPLKKSRRVASAGAARCGADPLIGKWRSGPVVFRVSRAGPTTLEARLVHPYECPNLVGHVDLADIAPLGGGRYRASIVDFARTGNGPCIATGRTPASIRLLTTNTISTCSTDPADRRTFCSKAVRVR